MQRGFTLIEIIMVSAIGAILVLASIPFFQSFSASHQLATNSETLLSFLRRAQNAAMAGKEDSRFGVYFILGKGGGFVFYRGDSYLARDTEYDDVHRLPQNLSLSINLLSFSSSPEINFGKIKGRPNATGTITLTSVNDETRVFRINQAGKIDIE